MTAMMIMVLAFLGVTALVGTLAFVFSDSGSAKLTERLDALTGRKAKTDPGASILRKTAFEQDRKSLL